MYRKVYILIQVHEYTWKIKLSVLNVRVKRLRKEASDLQRTEARFKGIIAETVNALLFSMMAFTE